MVNASPQLDYGKEKMNEMGKTAKLTLLTPGVLFVLAFYGLVIATRIEVGHWPYYHNPDAGVLSAVPFPWWHVLVSILFLLTVGSGIVGLPFAIAGKTNREKWIHRFSVLCVVTCAVSLVLVFADPGNFVNWFID